MISTCRSCGSKLIWARLTSGTIFCASGHCIRATLDVHHMIATTHSNTCAEMRVYKARNSYSHHLSLTQRHAPQNVYICICNLLHIHVNWNATTKFHDIIGMVCKDRRTWMHVRMLYKCVPYTSKCVPPILSHLICTCTCSISLYPIHKIVNGLHLSTVCVYVYSIYCIYYSIHLYTFVYLNVHMDTGIWDCKQICSPFCICTGVNLSMFTWK